MKNTTLVLGASLKENRYSNRAVKLLDNKGFSVRAIGNKEGSINAIKIVTEKLMLKDIDTVTLYLSAKNQVTYYDYILSLNANRVIFNPGTENNEFKNLLEENGVKTEVACTLVLLSTGQY